MSLQLEQVLRSVPVEQWVIRQSVVIDAGNGIREGWCALQNPVCCFYYRLYAEQVAGEQVADRLYEVGFAPADAIEQLLAVLEPLGPPDGPIWVPAWVFPTSLAEVRASQRIRTLLTQSKLDSGVVQGRSIDQLTGFWTKVNF